MRRNHSFDSRRSPALSWVYATARPSLAAAWACLLCLLALWLPLSVHARPLAAIELVSFDATPNESGILVAWETGSEVNNAGFELYRSESPSDRGALLGSFAPKGDLAGAYYEYQDNDVVDGITYYYTLLSFDVDGGQETHGPVSATAGTTATATATNTPTRQPTQTPTVTPPPTSPAQAPTSTPVATAAPATSTPVPTSPVLSTPSPTPLVRSTPTLALVTATLPPSSTSSTADPSAGQPGTSPPVEPAGPSTTPGQLQESMQPAAPAVDPAAQGATPTATSDPMALSAPPAAAEPGAALPPRAPRPTPRPAAEDGPGRGGLLALVAVGSLAAAVLVIGLMAVVMLRARS